MSCAPLGALFSVSPTHSHEWGLYHYLYESFLFLPACYFPGKGSDMYPGGRWRVAQGQTLICRLNDWHHRQARVGNLCQSFRKTTCSLSRHLRHRFPPLRVFNYAPSYERRKETGSWILSFVTHDGNSFLNKFIRWCDGEEGGGEGRKRRILKR